MSGPGKGIARRPAGKPAPVPVVESGKYRPGAKMWAFLSVAGWVGDGALTRGPLIVMLIMYPAGPACLHSSNQITPDVTIVTSRIAQSRLPDRFPTA